MNMNIQIKIYLQYMYKYKIILFSLIPKIVIFSSYK